MGCVVALAILATGGVAHGQNPDTKRLRITGPVTKSSISLMATVACQGQGSDTCTGTLGAEPRGGVAVIPTPFSVARGASAVVEVGADPATQQEFDAVGSIVLRARTPEALAARRVVWSEVEDGVSPTQPPFNRVMPSIAGAPVVGSTLTGSLGAWLGADTYAPQWKRCDVTLTLCLPISGATATAYEPIEDDYGQRLIFEVTAVGAHGSTTVASAPSPAIDSTPIPSVAPQVSGTVDVGYVLSSTDGTWASSSAVTYTRQWQRCDATGLECVAIDGQTSSSYAIVGGDRGRRFRILVTATNALGNRTEASPVTSVVPVTAAPIAPLTVFGQGGSFTSNVASLGGVTASSLNQPNEMESDADGGIYVADASQARVLYYPPGSIVATRVYGQGGSFTTGIGNKGGRSADSLSVPSGLAITPAGGLYVADTANNRVLYFPPGSTTATRVYGQAGSFTTGASATTAEGLSGPLDIAVDAINDYVYVADTNNRRVLRYEGSSTTATAVYGQAGSFTTSTDSPASASSVPYAQGVTVDSAGALYVTDTGFSRVLRFALGSTTATRVYGQGGSFTTGTSNKGGRSANSLFFPRKAVMDASNGLYVADASNNRVVYFPADSTTATAVYGQGGSFTTGTANNGGISATSLSGPRGISVGPGGMLLVADTANNRGLRYAP